MANTNILSVQITPAVGKPRSIPFFFPVGATLANIQAGADALLPLLDAAIDGKVTAATVQLALSLVGGLKGTAGGIGRQGALIHFDAAGTPYTHPIWIPTWKAAGFTGETVIIDSGAYAALLSSITGGFGTPGSTIAPSDPFANDLVSVIDGVMAFRK